MIRLNSASRRAQNALALNPKLPANPSKVVARAGLSLAIIRYSYYAFIFSIPFESTGFADNYLSVSKIPGLLFGLTAFLRSRVCFRRPPQAFWYFFGYLSVVMMMAPFQESQFTFAIVSRLLTLTQLLLLFWISYNVMADERVVKGTLLTLILSATLLAILMILGLEDSPYGERETALGWNPNALATILSLGLLGIVGLAFGRRTREFKVLLLMTVCSGVLAMQIVRTGSRGAVVALIVGFLAFPLKRTRRLASKIQLVLIGVLAIGFLARASYQSESVRERWESTFATGDTAGRDTIFSEAWGMFLERPLFGWGPVTHYYELGSRLGLLYRDTHNLYLWVLIETGILGAIPFFIGLWLCLWAAWNARDGLQGVLPLSMLLCLLINNMKGTFLSSKLFWIVLAYALASAYHATQKGRRHMVLPQRPFILTRRSQNQGVLDH
jgi:O-antigen ligase